MNSPLPAPAPAPRRNWARRLVNLLVALVVIAVAAAAFVFSYDGVHAIALLGGMSAQLARYYPGLFDAVLVIACVAAVMLRDGRWWARLWAWVVARRRPGRDRRRPTCCTPSNYTLPHRTTEGIVAAAPGGGRAARVQPAAHPAPPVQDARPRPALTPLLEVPALPAAVSAAPIALPPAATPRSRRRPPGPGGPVAATAETQPSRTARRPLGRRPARIRVFDTPPEVPPAPARTPAPDRTPRPRRTRCSPTPAPARSRGTARPRRRQTPPAA